MKTWNECCAEVGLSKDTSDAPVKKYIYYGYKGGVVREFSTELLARSFSTNTEKVVDEASNKLVEEYWIDRRHKENQAHDIWIKALELEFDYIDKEVFNMCYDKAFEDNHSEGRDSVYSKMEEYVDFAIEIANIYECRNK